MIAQLKHIKTTNTQTHNRTSKRGKICARDNLPHQPCVICRSKAGSSLVIPTQLYLTTYNSKESSGRCYMWGVGPFCQHLRRQFSSVINRLLGFLVEMVEINQRMGSNDPFRPDPILGFEAPTQPPGPTLTTLVGPEGLNPPSYTSYNPLAPLENHPPHGLNVCFGAHTAAAWGSWLGPTPGGAQMPEQAPKEVSRGALVPHSSPQHMSHTCLGHHVPFSPSSCTFLGPVVY